MPRRAAIKSSIEAAIRLLAAALPALASAQAPAPSAPPAPPHAEVVRGELAELLAAQQLPCGVVGVHVRRARLDYRVECATGHAYRIQVGADGRVTIKPDGPAAAAASRPGQGGGGATPPR